MAQLLHNQDSAFYGKELHGCRWGILQFFGFRRRLRSPKMLSDKKHGQEKNSRGSRRRSHCYAPLTNEDSGILDDNKNTEVTKKQKASKRKSGKASLRSLILRKLYGKEGQKEKMLPVAPKLLRTISIHYLESNEYVLDGESTSSGDGSSHSTKLSMQNATDMNLHHATSSIPDGCDSDLSSSLLLKRDDIRMKRKSHRSISMDGILHKVPYGQKVSGDVISEGLPRSASASYDRDGVKPYFGTATKRHVNQGFRRSRSLSESWENYSRLLDSISSNESKRILTNSKSTRDHSLDGPRVITSLQRTSEAFRSQGFDKHDENLVTAEDALEPHVQEKTDINIIVEVVKDESSLDMVAGVSENPALPDECVDDKTEEDTCTAPSPSEVDISEEQTLSCGQIPSSEVELYDIQEEHAETYDDDQIHSSTQADACSTSSEVDIPEEHAKTYDDDQIHSSTQADAYTSLSSKEFTISEEHTPISHDSQMHSFQISKPIEDDPDLPVKRTLLDDTLLNPRILHLNDADASTGTSIVQESDFDGLQVDPRQEIEFNYVKDIFKKSSFSNEILFDEWHSQNITALQQVDCQHYEAAAASFDFTDMSADQLLLFDLTNEALLDIYKKYSVSKSRFSWFSSLDRPKPVGNRVLNELWSRVSYHLDERSWSSIEVDTILSNDLAKSDPWTNFPRDADHLGNKLADFVFDKLLTELVLQLAEF
ncbi:uncharacterized protein LOC8073300 isoform X2 [Sorghum bicolor]|uniref:DUF4378 domain-containing protein n=1 Tax=Sorghum bicolor TaxID=4558 RepID=A0A1B6Q1T1_SORBI|nr:uncharacterized protein LOC8073300 isoform X2 [Sorghum bicolor]KXG31882.1 hypothetical protein SORBI_3003G071700 [Sorghum bicolor]OQU86317.1 hypothetical protein SORBI_3003G071700 [Sorghum bicolor]|eukprot:XP_021313481.1 uncharacterized protein LOC8073300 isoform X2 [Sorghum bicolor]